MSGGFVSRLGQLVPTPTHPRAVRVSIIRVIRAASAVSPCAMALVRIVLSLAIFAAVVVFI